MTICIDYDDTWTKAAPEWMVFVNLMRAEGHRVVMCTNRLSEQKQDMTEAIDNIGADNVYFAGSSLKRPFMISQGVHVDVWIDDSPEMIGEAMYL